MTATLTIDEAAFTTSLMAEIEKAKIPCQAAMAYTFAEDAYNSFGESGSPRMNQWNDLSKKYAKNHHGGNRTPTLVLSGELRESIKNGINISQADCATVSTDVPYAGLMQFGGKSEEGYNIPARPFFPIVGKDVWEPTAIKCVEACAEKLESILK